MEIKEIEEEIEELSIAELYEEIAKHIISINDESALYQLIKKGERTLVCQDQWLYDHWYQDNDPFGSSFTLVNKMRYYIAKDKGEIPKNYAWDDWFDKALYEEKGTDLYSIDVEEHWDGEHSFYSVIINCSDEALDYNLLWLIQIFDEKAEAEAIEIEAKEEAERERIRQEKKRIRDNTPIKNVIDCTEDSFERILAMTLEDLPTLKTATINVGGNRVILADNKNAIVSTPFGKVSCSATVEDILSAFKKRV